VRIACLLAALFASVPGFASPIDVELSPSAIAGKGKPAVIVAANVPARNVRLRLSRRGCGSDAKVLQSVERLAAGQSHRFEIDQPVGRCDYDGALEADINGQRASMPLQFSAEIAGPPEVRPVTPGFDAQAHTVVVTFNRVADHGSVEAFAEGGHTLGVLDQQELGDAKPGEPLTLSFPAGDQAVLKLHVTVYDPDGLFAGLDLFPWSMKVPHAEVNFASGSAEVQPDEQPKLRESAARIAEALNRVGRTVPLKLFVVGYTDTVGTAESNQALSSQRAQAIARYFRAHGISVPILTAGLGEDALLVGTPDETAEVRNRRAEYILAVDPPIIDNAARQPSWAPLK
jgi:outer membrane protein OmpA-like peptidoglycan-associated protein